MQQATERLKTASFHGLFHFDVEEDATTGELRLRGLSAGWPWLHTEVFLAELTNFGEVLQGSLPELARRFVTVLPVTQPPWPNSRQGERREPIEVKGLTPTQQGQAFWFDVSMDTEHRKLFTVGLDGLLMVATGSSDSSPALARARALELAVRLDVPEKQYRVDAGQLVDPVLSTLEERWGVVLS
ncbi:MAG: hypothetical protein ACE5Q6_08230 [Dehalococcoidia bacterium]